MSSLPLSNHHRYPPLLNCQSVSKVFREGNFELKVLKAINFMIQPQERVAIVGASGSGKSTLLHILGGLDTISAGKVEIFGQDFHQLKEPMRSTVRNRHLGFIYQFHHLLPEFTVLENVCMPLLIAGENPKKAILKAQPLLKKAGLAQRAQHKPSELSGGEKQRTAIVRALITQPNCILADEPTGNLDNRTAAQVFEMLLELNQSSLILVTHDNEFAKRMDRVLKLENGCLESADI